MGQRQGWAIAVALVIGLSLVTLALIAWNGESDEVASATSVTRSGDQDPDAIDVVLLVPDQDDADRTSELMLDSLDMWQTGLAGIDAELTIRPVAERVGDGAAAHRLLDPEVVVIAASVGIHDGPGAERAVEIYDGQGARCDAFPDPFSMSSWSALPTFRSHHSLPEGIVRQPCADGGEICVAVNATLDPDSGVSPFEAFTLVGDELGHCLRQAASGSR